MLIGRERECARIDELLDRARRGRSGALVIRGEPGIGKTALLDYAAQRAEAATVVRTLGVESEAELEFSALHEICRPLLGFLEELPGQQADALRAVLRLGPPVALDRFAVGAATLSLLAAAAEASPLVILADDGQWLDPASADALLFATRRLEADRAAVLFAARDADDRPFDAPGIEELRVGALGLEDAKAVLRSRGEVADGVAERLHEATRGNPLALLEALALLPQAQLQGVEPLEDPLPVGAGVEHAFAGRAAALPDDARKALLVAAVSTSSSLPMVVAALEALGLDRRALEPAEDAGLVRFVAGRLEFRHPLVRSAVYQAAVASERRAAHRALADVGGESGLEERAWHLAAAALGPDEEAAAALEDAARSAGRRSGYAPAAIALERAARLTPENAARLRRLAAAADAAWRAGRAKTAAALVREALAGADDVPLRADALRLHGEIEYFTGRADVAAHALLAAMDLLEAVDPAGAVVAGADAANALVRLGQLDRALETAERARALVPDDGSESDAQATATLGYALSMAGRSGEAESQLRRAMELQREIGDVPGPLEAIRLAAALAWLGEYEEGHRYFADLVARARSTGAVGSLPYLLTASSWQALHADRWNEAEADAGEAYDLAEELDQPPTRESALGVLTWVTALRGDEARCRAYGEETRKHARELGYTIDDYLVAFCYGLLALSAGRIDEAIGELEAMARYSEERHLRIPRVAPQLELAEALTRVGRLDDAVAIIESVERSELVSDPVLGAVSKRCRGLLADENDVDAVFGEALDLHSRGNGPFATARTRLCYGERLRRAGRRRDARQQLRSALATFETLGAGAWAERARSELRSSGETLRRRESHEAEQLTPQELQIALQVAEGKTNKEVGAALFLSHKTVEFHLGRIYRKLEINSRAELIRRFATEPVAAPSAS